MIDAAGPRYLIVGGTTKAGTTSMFRYLSDHPGICAASMKETRFFLDPAYPLPSKYRFGDGLSKYEEFFSSGRPGGIRVEATPDYLHSPGTASRIRDTLEAAVMVFILRDPVSRLVSWYRFAKQTGLLSRRTSFEDYLACQTSMAAGGEESRPQHLRALEQGRYSRYLRPYLAAFGPGRICVLLFEDLVSKPRVAVGRVCEIAGLDAGFYEQYRFAVHNPTGARRVQGIERLYMRLRYAIRKRTHHRARLHQALKRMRKAVDSVYLPANGATSAPIRLSGKVEGRLREYYSDEPSALEAMLGVRIPWTMSADEIGR